MNNEDLEFFVKNWSRIQPVVFNYILSIVRRPHDVDDVMQEVAITVCNDLHRYDRNREFLPWVLSIARFRSLDHLKKSKRDKLVLSHDSLDVLEEPISEMSLHDADRQSALARCMKRLQPRAARIIHLRYASGFAVKDIADRLGSKPNTVAQMLSRSRGALLECVRRVMKEVS